MNTTRATDPAVNESDELSSRLADVLARLADAEEQLAGYADRVSMSYEELAFLRRLAEYIQFCTVDQGVESVAATMLPSLRELIGAEAVLLVRPKCPDRSGMPDAGMPDAGKSDGPGADDLEMAASEGAPPAALAVTAALLRRYGDAAWARPIVYNAPVGGGRANGTVGCGLDGVRSCLLVPVAKGEFRVGWLVAIEKVDASFLFERSAREGDFIAAEAEFGTYEATLVAAVATTLATHAANCEMFRQKEQLLIGVIRTLINTLDARDAYTRGHSERVARVGRCLAAHMGLPEAECERIYVTGLLHDIGKIGVPDAVLRKPGQLSDDEFATIQTHPEIGVSILEGLEQLNYVLPGVLHHHERIDGKGYPHRLAGETIPLAARILAVADSFDAMTSDRPYRSGMPMEKAEEILRSHAGTQWDAAVVDALTDCRDGVREICGLDRKAPQPTDEEGRHAPASSE